MTTNRPPLGLAWFLLLTSLGFPFDPLRAAQPIRLHPDNPRYFQ